MLSRVLVAAPVTVETDWLARHMYDANVVIVDMTADDMQYSRYHIPGAVRIAYADIVMPRKQDKVSVRLPDGLLEKGLGGLGISADQHIVLYDDMGGMEAGRLFWELERIGHKQVSVVNGGLVRWVLEGRKVDNTPVVRKATDYIAPGKGLANEADMGFVRDASGRGSAVLLDVRSQQEYLGHPAYPRSGHVPGAQWWPWEGSVAFNDGFVMKPEKELLASLKAIGVEDRQAPLVVYCHSGHRASQSYLVLRKLGFQNVRLYDGSMAEYELNKSAPVVNGLR
jgi:thiosulfate/3-mercaptopyruvate sulfurtransferase